MSMHNRISIAAGFALILASAAAATAGPVSYSALTPRTQYMIDRSAEIALARSAAPPSISKDAGVMVLGAHGFEMAERGTNGFVCLVERPWDKPYGDAEFWNPKMHGPVCLNAAAVRSVLPLFEERAKWAMAGLSMDEMAARAKTSKVAATPPEIGAMSYMMSKQQYLQDSGKAWYPHVMFFSPKIDPALWGANMDASPVLGTYSDGITIFFIPVRKWSDGTLADYGVAADGNSASHHH